MRWYVQEIYDPKMKKHTDPTFYGKIEAWLSKQGVSFKLDPGLPNGFGWIKDGKYIGATAIDAYNQLIRNIIEMAAKKISVKHDDPLEFATRLAEKLGKPEWLKDYDHCIWDVVEERYLG